MKITAVRTGYFVPVSGICLTEVSDQSVYMVGDQKRIYNPQSDQPHATLRQSVLFHGLNLFEPASVQALRLRLHAVGRDTP